MNSKTHMLATDLDGTLVGNEEALRKLIVYFSELHYDVSLVYVTGRHLASAIELIEAENLPLPDVLITDVGTAIYLTADFEEDVEWKKRMQNDWQPNQIIQKASAFPSLIRQALPHERRISFTISEDNGAVSGLEEELIEGNIPHLVIVSSSKDVDILPPGSGKGNALSYVIDQYAKKDVQILVAGDSGNDIEMITLGYPAVIVGNAQSELIELDAHPQLYRAKQHSAGGILEAWDYFYGV